MKVSGESTQNTDHRFISSPKEELLYEIKSPQQQSVEPFFFAIYSGVLLFAFFANFISQSSILQQQQQQNLILLSDVTFTSFANSLNEKEANQNNKYNKPKKVSIIKQQIKI